MDFEILLPIGYPFVISITMRASCLILSCPCNFFSFFGGRTLLFLGSSVFGFEARGDLLFRCLFFFVFLFSRPCVSYLANSRGLAGLMRRNDGNEPSRCFFSCACVFCAIHTFAVLLVFIFILFFIYLFFFFPFGKRDGSGLALGCAGILVQGLVCVAFLFKIIDPDRDRRFTFF